MNFLKKSIGIGDQTKSLGVIQETPITNFPFMAPTTTASGVTVNSRTALEHEAVYTCVRTLTGDIAKIPLVIERRNPAGGWEFDFTHTLNLILETPNDRHTSFEFIEQIIFSTIISGDGFAVVIRDKRGNPTKIIPMSPFNVSVIEDSKDGELYYKVDCPMLIKEKTSISSERGSTRTIYHKDMIRLRNLSLDNGKNGYSVIELAREAIGLALATQEAAARAYSNGANISGFFKPSATLGAEQVQAMTDKMKTAIAGLVNSGKTGVLPGLDYVPINKNVADLQLIEARQQIAYEVARMFRVPPYKLGLGDSEKAANVAEQEQSYITNTLVQYTRPLEQHMNRVLFNASERRDYRIRFDFSKQAEPNEAVRADFYSRMISYGVMCPNEARQREGLAPREGGDQYVMAINTGVLGDKEGAPITGDNNNETNS